MGVLFTIVVFILVLGALVLIHEFGHFIAAKKAGIEVEEFGIGFPPKIVGKRWRGTEYTLNWLPFGGFVRIKGVVGEEGADADDAPDSFATKPMWIRFAILFAGIFMNLALAVVLFTIVFAAGAERDVTGQAGFDDRAIVTNQYTMIGAVADESPAATAELQAGDKITQIGETYRPSVAEVQAAAGQTTPVTIIVDRNDQTITTEITPQVLQGNDQEYTGIGVALREVATVRYPVHIAAVEAVTFTGYVVVQIAVSLWDILGNIFTTGEVGEAVAGPVGIAVLTGEVARTGIIELLQFAALLSVNLALFNLFPIPALDGGRIAFLAVEAVRRKPVDEKIQAVIHNIGFLLLIGLIVLITFRDIAGLL